MSVEALRIELDFFSEKKSELLTSHPGQFVLIKGRSIVGIYPTPKEAYDEGFRRFVQEPFLVKQIVEREGTEQVPLLANQLKRASL